MAAQLRRSLFTPFRLASRSVSSRAAAVLSRLDLPGDPSELPGVYDGRWHGSTGQVVSRCPATGEELGKVKGATIDELHSVLSQARQAHGKFRMVPAPKRGDILRQIRDAVALKKDALAELIALEMGKIKSEGLGEVQEFIDICDYAVGLSRMLNGRVVPSERAGHLILEVPNPLGVVAVLSAFNFPVAVYGWNLALSFVAGNATLWKPSPTTPLCSIAITSIVADILEHNGIPGATACLVTGGNDIGAALVASTEVDLVSFTGSEKVGRNVSRTVASRFGKILLELGGNNASVVMPDADLSIAVPSIFFGAVGTTGQRCTSTRRLYLHESIAHDVLHQLSNLYSHLKPGDPLSEGTTIGPLHNRGALDVYLTAIEHLKSTGANILVGGERYRDSPLDSGYFVQPTIAVPKNVDVMDDIWQTETFAPILNVAIFQRLEQAIGWNNCVPQGLSSSIWTRDIGSIGQWIGPSGSDTGIVNVNVGTSGAEIGAAFGGNKSTGWGRESGGDAWKQYVRWSACTINFSSQAPLAQGIQFI